MLLRGLVTWDKPPRRVCDYPISKRRPTLNRGHVEVRVKERSSHPLESMVEHDSICLASFGLRLYNFEYQLITVTNTLSSCGIICSFR